MQRNLFVALLLIATAIFAQSSVLVDDAPMCGHHDRTTWHVLWDSLVVHGASIDFTTETGRFPDLSGYDLIILMHHRSCAEAGFDFEQRGQIIDFVCNGGNLLIMPSFFYDIRPHNFLLRDSRWFTGLSYVGFRGTVLTERIMPYPPLTNGIDHLNFDATLKIEALHPAYPFVWDETFEHIICAVSYPERTDGEDCDCHLGGRIIAFPDCTNFITYFDGFVELMNFRFIINTLKALARVEGYDIDDCCPPRGIARIDSIPCAEPGETVYIYGNQFDTDMDLMFERSDMTYTFHDSTLISFELPSFIEQGVHSVTIEYDIYSFSEDFYVYCDWLEIDHIGSFCAEIGDTVWIYGQNFSLDARISIDEEEIYDFEIMSDSSGWFIMPDTSGFFGYPVIGESYRYKVCIENEPTNSDCADILVPCPCPPDSDIVCSIENIRFWERNDGTDTVYIVYDLICDTPQNIVLYCSDDSGLTYDVHCTNVFGAIGDSISSGDSLVIVWNAGVDVPDTESLNLVFRLEAVGGDLADGSEMFALAVGGESLDAGLSYKQTNDGGFAIAGVTNSYGAGNFDLFLVKFSDKVDVEWALTIGGTGEDASSSIVQTTDGGFAFAGHSTSYATGHTDIFLVKLSSERNLEWARTIGGAFNEYGSSFVQTTDGGFVVSGKTASFGAGSDDLFLVKFSSEGEVEWARAVGGTSREYGISAVQTTDGGYAVAGYTRSFGAGDDDLFLVKFSAGGEVEWARAVGGTSRENGISAVQTSDGSFVVAGETESYGAGYSELFFVKFSSDGEVEWAPVVGGTNIDFASSVVQTSEGSFAVAGNTHSYGSGNIDFFLLEFSSEGEVEWAQAVGGTNTEFANSVVQTPNSSFIVTGYTESFGAGNSDLFLVKFDATGNSCLGEFISPIVTDVSPTVTDVSPTITDVTLTATDVSPIVTDVSPLVTEICDSSLVCPFGAVFSSAESNPGPIDTKPPEISVTCPPGGNVGEDALIVWTATDSFIPPWSIGPEYPVEIFYTAHPDSNWRFIGYSTNIPMSFDWHYPRDLTDNAMIAVCVTDSFGHIACDTCGPFSITGDVNRPTGYAYGDTCSPDQVYFVLHDDIAIDWNSVCVQDAFGVLCWPDSMRLVGDSMIVFLPRLPDESDFADMNVIRLFSAHDEAGNGVHEMVIVDSLVHLYHHPCGEIGVPYAEFVFPEPFVISACDNQRIVIRIVDPTQPSDLSGIDESSIVISIDGVEFTIADERLSFDGEYLIFTPESAYFNEGSATVEIIDAINLMGEHITSPDPLQFTIDLTPPNAHFAAPPGHEGETWESTPVLSFEITDEISDVNPERLILSINGDEFYNGDFSFDQPWLTFDCSINDIDFSDIDTVEVELFTCDSPTPPESLYCSANCAVFNWHFQVLHSTECSAVPKPFTPSMPNNSYVQFDFPKLGTEAAEIHIYNIRNIEVAILEVPSGSPAKEASRWYGNDNAGYPQRQGVYLYVIECDGEVVCNGVVVLAR